MKATRAEEQNRSMSGADQPESEICSMGLRNCVPNYPARIMKGKYKRRIERKRRQ
jgi:hypothetical protein